MQSKISILKGSLSADSGLGIFRAIFSMSSGMPMPVLALVSTASSAGMAKTSSNCASMAGMSALGKSILLITGIISSPC